MYLTIYLYGRGKDIESHDMLRQGFTHVFLMIGNDILCGPMFCRILISGDQDTGILDNVLCLFIYLFLAFLECKQAIMNWAFL